MQTNRLQMAGKKKRLLVKPLFQTYASTWFLAPWIPRQAVPEGVFHLRRSRGVAQRLRLPIPKFAENPPVVNPLYWV